MSILRKKKKENTETKPNKKPINPSKLAPVEKEPPTEDPRLVQLRAIMGYEDLSK
jgi:hypothetical protein